MRAFISILHFLTAGTHTHLGLHKVLCCCYSSTGFVTEAVTKINAVLLTDRFCASYDNGPWAGLKGIVSEEIIR